MEQENLHWIQEHQPELLRELRPLRSELRAGPSKKGPLSLLMGDVPVHSKYDPVREAQKLVEGEPADLHLHFGFGLGYWAEADQVAEGGRMLIFEPDAAQVTAALSLRDLRGLFEGEKAQVFCNPVRFEMALEAAYRGDLKQKIFISPFHRERFPQELQFFENCLARIRFSWNLSLQTLHKRGPLLSAAAIQAFPLAWRCPSVTALESRFKGLPALIVSAGPSLQRNLHDLVPYADKCLIFALARTAPLLESVGIRPHFLVHNEFGPFYGLIESCTNLDETLFLLSDHAEPAFFRRAGRHALCFRSPANLGADWLREIFPWFQNPVLESGGSVANEAFTLALLAGCDPIVLIGQDLGWTGKHFYAAPETNLNPVYCEDSVRMVSGYFGGNLQTYTSYLSYNLWFSRRARQLQETHPHRLINATEGGAEISGFQKRSLRETAFHFFQKRIPEEALLALRAKAVEPETHCWRELRVPFEKTESELAALERLLVKGLRLCKSQLETQAGKERQSHQLARQLDKVREAYTERMASLGILGGFMQKQLWDLEQQREAEQAPGASEAETLRAEMRADVLRIQAIFEATQAACTHFAPLLAELLRTKPYIR